MALARLTLVTLVALYAIAVKSETRDPEKKITISIFDLVKKRGSTHGASEHKSELDRKYVDLVVAALKEKRSSLLSCLKSGEALTAKILIVIASQGEAKVSSLDKDDTLSDCAVKVLSEVNFPAHHLKGNVEIELPLSLEKRTL